MTIRMLALLCAATLALSACGGTKLVRHAPALPEHLPPLASASDARLGVALGFVIVRNGPGAWARNADWDEYLLHVHNASAAPVQILSLDVIDSSDHAATTLDDRKQLVKASKQ
ncbi:MAG: hypothetical protein EOP93_16710, partial [Lysobacteraceae bacterium]